MGENLRVSWIEGGFGGQLLPQTLFLITHAGRDLDGDGDIKIASLARADGQTFAPDAQLMSLLGAGRHL
jgi:hypothetical protein